MNADGSNYRNHAIVIGGSMAGLLAGRVLAEHYERVTILERDRFPAIGEQRRGVPQGRHTHGLLAGGRRILEKFFPGISNELIAAGAVSGDAVRDGNWFFEGGCHQRFESGLNSLLVSRPLLEGTVRMRLKALSNVQVRENYEVGGLTATRSYRRVTGVRIAGEELAADLVVDTTGRGSHAGSWLEDLGYRKAREERVEVGLGYTTRLFRRYAQDLDGDLAAIIPPTPEGKRGGVMIAQEGDRWTVTLIGHFGNYAPAELPGFIEFARSLPSSHVYELVRNAEPIGEPAVARFPASVRRRYEDLKRFPEGFLVFGDAISSFNPIYGQGMSVAALQAVELQATLVEGSNNLAGRFFRKAAKAVDTPWSIAVGNDLRMPEAKGRRTTAVKFINWYMAKLHRAAHVDPVPAMAFHQVGNLLAPPSSILSPRVVARVVWANLRPRPKARRTDSALRPVPNRVG
jgi:2-polyprenyl-6-methoxyphenol hydroxylase-like FAD-dependent oxidoreductase